ncbi:MAG: cell envelope-related transcriptional attenuator [Candidatus Doudnabacteria bacterium Gr01-1014_77]|uniref:Cell envelope-related transcriptional attenuator n=1 Tax=Candidatus Doudnabacteria bacterium Gr01-1014_77 TaxID=2017133 RepID=A0A554JAP7_9BACT|nr:MAG: cell envelope-related transcriptional attenuator [Candidatus Doudnabacteria bacterium Gr01-1014_77]
MRELDIRRVPKHNNFKLHGTEKQFQVHHDFVSEKHLIIPPDVGVTQVFQPKRSIFRFRSFVLYLFTFIVLGAGIVIGIKANLFISAISTSKQGAYESITNNIGATFGTIIPALKSLDSSAVAEAIRDEKSVNLLLLGYGGEGHGGSYLTDTMMVANLNFKTDSITYIPVPRDTWVKIPTHGYDGIYAKINAAYAYGIDSKNYPNKLPQFSGVNGGGSLSKYEISQVLGIHVDYYLAMDFSGFKKIVDTLGGVEIDVENSFTDYSYPSGDKNVDAASCTSEELPDSLISECRYKKVSFEKGLQYMDGSMALEYARSRHAAGIEGSDFSRSKRQQKLISAIAHKAASIGALSKVFSLMDVVSNHFKTDLSVAEIKDLADYLKTADNNGSLKQAKHLSLTDEPNFFVSSWSEDKQWILIPAAGFGDFSDIKEYIKGQLE